jgi:predicted HTH domain antitoxin
LAKAAEAMEVSREELQFLLDKLGIDFYFLSDEDIKKEKNAANKLLKELKD